MPDIIAFFQLFDRPRLFWHKKEDLFNNKWVVILSWPIGVGSIYDNCTIWNQMFTVRAS